MLNPLFCLWLFIMVSHFLAVTLLREVPEGCFILLDILLIFPFLFFSDVLPLSIVIIYCMKIFNKMLLLLRNIFVSQSLNFTICNLLLIFHCLLFRVVTDIHIKLDLNITRATKTYCISRKVNFH